MDNERAKEEIATVFNDTTVERTDTREHLEELRSLIDDYLASLDDSEHNSGR